MFRGRNFCCQLSLGLVGWLAACSIDRQWPDPPQTTEPVSSCQPETVSGSWTAQNRTATRGEAALISACVPADAPSFALTWQAPADGRYRAYVQAQEEDSDPSVALFAAGCEGPETACQADVGGLGEVRSLDAAVEFDAKMGESFALGVANTHVAAREQAFELRIGPAPQCPLWPEDKDEWHGELDAAPGLWSHPLCPANGAEALVRWRAPKTGIFEFSTEGSDFDTSLFAFSPLVNNEVVQCMGDLLDCSSTGPLDKIGKVGKQAALVREFDEGEEITLVVDGAQADASGSFTVAIQEVTCPSFELVAETLPGESIEVYRGEGSFFNARDLLRRLDNNSCALSNFGAYTPDLAFSWMPPAVGYYLVSVVDSAGKAPEDIRIYQLEGGSCLAKDCVDVIDNGAAGTIRVQTVAETVLVVEWIGAGDGLDNPDIFIEVRPL